MEVHLGREGSPAALVLRGDRSVFGNVSGLVIEPDGFSGWDDGGSLRADAPDRPIAHGAFDAPGFLGARVLSFSGHAFADSPEELDALRWQLTGYLANGERGRVTIDHQGATLWADVRLVSTRFTTLGSDPTVGRFQIDLICRDPRKYGETRSFAGGVEAHHGGNFPALPVFRVTGGQAGYSITGPGGKRFVVDAGGSAGDVHEIRMRDGLLRVNGQVTYGRVSRPSVWALPGGTRFAHSITAGSLTTLLTDTFI